MNSKNLSTAQNKVIEELFFLYKAYLPLICYSSTDDQIIRRILVLIAKDRYVIAVRNSKVVGFIESYRLNAEQVEQLIAEAQWTITHDVDDSFPVCFDISREDINTGIYSWVDNVCIDYSYRGSRVMREMYKNYLVKNKDAVMHQGHRFPRKAGLVISIGRSI